MDNHRLPQEYPPTQRLPQQESYLRDDDYLRFLRSLGDDNALPEDDDDDPDFATDLQKMLEEMSDDDARDYACIADWALWSAPLPEQTNDPHALQNRPQTSYTPSNDLDGLIGLSPARCTRSRYSLNTMDIEQLEQRLMTNVDYSTFDELPEVSPFDHSPTIEAAQIDDLPPKLQDFDEQSVTNENPHRPLQQKNASTSKRKKQERPSPEFRDIFEQEISQIRRRSVHKSMDEIHTNAWTPDMILCLNRIANAHTQLLFQSFAVCVGLPHLRHVSEEMHAQLHSLYQMFHAQSGFDYGFPTMMKIDVPQIVLSNRRPKGRGRVKRQKNSDRSVRKRSRKDVYVTEGVIDLTAGQDGGGANINAVTSSLDVPLLHVLPHLWQALMVIAVEKQGLTFDAFQAPPCGLCNRNGQVPFLKYPRDVQRAMCHVEGLMTIGLAAQNHSERVKGRAAWSPTELALFRYCIRKHGGDFHLIKARALPAKDVKALEKKVLSLGPDADTQWKAIEDTLLRTDAASTWSTGMPEKILEAQINLFKLCNAFKNVQQEKKQSKMELSPFEGHNTKTLKLLQGLVQKSTCNLVQQVLGSNNGLIADGSAGGNVMQNIMCLLLGQIGSHLAGSFDTVFTMMSMIAGMQLLSEVENTSERQRAEIMHLLQRKDGTTCLTRTEEKTAANTSAASNC